MTLSMIRGTLSSVAHSLGFKIDSSLPHLKNEKKEKNDNFKDISAIRPLGKAKFTVYLAHSKGKTYAMKVFPYVEDKPHRSFQNEVRFSFLQHPNIIRIYHSRQERIISSQECSKKVSYIVMEYAPYGNFFDFATKLANEIDDRLIRTYFKQLIEGIEHLHKNGISHMDLKLENLLMGENFTLKIADFDLSCIYGDTLTLGSGTKCYRPPEVIKGQYISTKTADIYSAGVLLFILKTRGKFPHTEEKHASGIDFANLMYSNNDEFWKKHCEVQKKDFSFFDEDFRSLFNAMPGSDPKDRATIAQIKESKWYKGPSYTQKELEMKIHRIYKVLENK